MRKNIQVFRAIWVDSLNKDRNIVKKKVCQIEGDNKRVFIGALPRLKCSNLLVYQAYYNFITKKYEVE